MSTRNDRQRILVHHPEPLLVTGILATLRSLAGFEVLAGDPVTSASLAACVVVCSYETSLQLADDARPRGARVVVVTRKARDFEIQRSMESGALAYVVASCSLGELEGAVRAASQGRRFLCQASAEEVANGLTGESLTARERDVLILLAKGHCNKTIANHLDIAVGTVKAHVRGVMAKLQATSRTEAASIAGARGLLPEAMVDDPVAPLQWRAMSGERFAESASA